MVVNSKKNAMNYRVDSNDSEGIGTAQVADEKSGGYVRVKIHTL